jgi:hypothetical protein
VRFAGNLLDPDAAKLSDGSWRSAPSFAITFLCTNVQALLFRQVLRPTIVGIGLECDTRASRGCCLVLLCSLLQSCRSGCFVVAGHDDRYQHFCTAGNWALCMVCVPVAVSLSACWPASPSQLIGMQVADIAAASSGDGRPW